MKEEGEMKVRIKTKTEGNNKEIENISSHF